MSKRIKNFGPWEKRNGGLAGRCGVSEISAASIFKIHAGPLLTLQTEAPDPSDTVTPVCRCKPEHSNGDVMTEDSNGGCENY